jgi:large repetitive protein
MKARSGLVALLLWISASQASAQRSADVHFFRPALFSGGIFSVDRASPANKWQPGFKFFFNYEQSPLRLNFPGYGEEDIISNAQVFNLQAQFGIQKWLELAIDFPVARYSLTSNEASDLVEGFERLAVNDPKTNVGYPNATPLDMRIGIKVPFLDWNGLQLAVAVIGSLPLGDEEYFGGEKSFTLLPELIAGWNWRSLALAVNLGYRLRQRNSVVWEDPAKKDGEVPLLNFDDEFTFSFGALFQLHRVIAIGAEVYGVVPVITGGYDVTTKSIEYNDSTKCTTAGATPPCDVVTSRRLDLPQTTVMEALGGVVITPVTGVNIALGAGAGVLGDERRTALRIFAGISWLPGAEGPTIARDRDGDGIPDDKDECPDQAEDKDGFQDEDGCPDLDNDGDGIPDTLDKCPNEPEDKDGFQDDDGCPDPDNDGDGICDPWVEQRGEMGKYPCKGVDKCPNEAEDKDGFQDDDGCPDPDNDGDGIADATDKCPNEPETKNGYQDEDGCPDEVPGQVVMGKGKIEIKDKIRFKKGAAEIDPTSNSLLDEIAKVVLANPQAGRIRIEGHTDNVGPKNKNQTLSQKRAESVKAYLVKKGVKADRLIAVGYGPSRPIASNKTAEGKAKNRRVEFIVIQAP